MVNRLFKVVSLAALVVFPAYGQNLSVPDHVVAMTTNLQFITEDDVDQRTKLDLLLEQKQIDREGVIRELSMDIFKIAKAEGAGLLSDALVDKAFRRHVLATRCRSGRSHKVTGGEGHPARRSEKAP